jgi:hypothetical protein
MTPKRPRARQQSRGAGLLRPQVMTIIEKTRRLNPAGSIWLAVQVTRSAIPHRYREPVENPLPPQPPYMRGDPLPVALHAPSGPSPVRLLRQLKLVSLSLHHGLGHRTPGSVRRTARRAKVEQADIEFDVIF